MTVGARPESFSDRTDIRSERGRGDSPACLLVVEDDKNIRRCMSEALSRVGHQVDTAEDGAAGWAAIQTHNYHLLITDHNMPKLSGIELVTKLRAARMALPAILMSGALPTHELNTQPPLRIEAVLEKPFTADQLIGTVAEVLRATSAPDRPAAGVHSKP